MRFFPFLGALVLCVSARDAGLYTTKPLRPIATSVTQEYVFCDAAGEMLGDWEEVKIVQIVEGKEVIKALMWLREDKSPFPLTITCVDEESCKVCSVTLEAEEGSCIEGGEYKGYYNRKDEGATVEAYGTIKVDQSPEARIGEMKNGEGMFMVDGDVVMKTGEVCITVYADIVVPEADRVLIDGEGNPLVTNVVAKEEGDCGYMYEMCTMYDTTEKDAEVSFGDFSTIVDDPNNPTGGGMKENGSASFALPSLIVMTAAFLYHLM